MNLPTRAELEEARRKAEAARREADALQDQARNAKRRADARQKHYSDLLEILQGQIELNYEET